MLPVSAKLLWHLAPLTSLYSLKDPLPSRTWHNCPPKSHQPCSWLCCPKPLHAAVEASSRKTELLSEERETLIRDRGDQKLLSHRLYHACCQGLEKGILCQREKWEERNNFCLPKEKRLVSSHPSYFFSLINTFTCDGWGCCDALHHCELTVPSQPGWIPCVQWAMDSQWFKTALKYENTVPLGKLCPPVPSVILGTVFSQVALQISLMADECFAELLKVPLAFS